MTALLVLAACGGSNDDAESAESSDGLSSGEPVSYTHLRAHET